MIHSVQPEHTGLAKRYSVKIILKKPSTKEEIAALTHAIVNEMADVNAYSSQRSENLWFGKPVNIVFCYFGNDKEDVINSNFVFRSVWVDSSQDKTHWYHSSKNAQVLDDVLVVTIPYYDSLKKFNADNIDNAESLERAERKIISEMISLAERVIYVFNELQNGTLNEEDMQLQIQPMLHKINSLYFEESELGIVPIELHKWCQQCSNIAATIYDFVLYYGTQFFHKRTAENRQHCMKQTIKRYHYELQKLKACETTHMNVDDEQD